MKPFSGKVDDKCPSWARDVIDQIRILETQLGNIPASDEWQTGELEKLAERVFGANQSTTEQTHLTEALFSKIARGLSSEGFSAQDVATFVNSRIGYEGGPPYCSTAEVLEQLD